MTGEKNCKLKSLKLCNLYFKKFNYSKHFYNLFSEKYLSLNYLVIFINFSYASEIY